MRLVSAADGKLGAGTRGSSGMSDESRDGSGDDGGNEPPPGMSTLRDLISFLSALTGSVGADFYMLLAVPNGRSAGSLRILASNWTFDAIQLAGHPLLARLVGGPFTAAPGSKPQPILTSGAPNLGGMMSGEEAALLHALDHAELWPLRVQAGSWRFFLLLSGAETGTIAAEAIARAQLECCYGLSQLTALLASAVTENPLSERQRQCMDWVSEGKTTEEIAVILGVAPNTVASYITHAMQKLGAGNRPKAVATAIRSGII